MRIVQQSVMLRILRAPLCSTSAHGMRHMSITATCSVKKIVSETEGNTTTVQLVDVPDTDTKRVLKKSDDTCSLCTCNIPVKIKYSDVLILEQFMREDGTVLPRQLTGLCKKQQLRIERCVMQAHWAGLFPDKTIPSFDRAGYKRFSRYWNDDMDMYRLKQKIEEGTWYYVKRYRSVGDRKANY
ncbi:28S ribosomal protein S18a, mitochondrial [Toxocara canis]|uniref:28S ribosomal protein S18a, mitochondrial n=1 Tax=Toxocara canis TaxID=6265 RepID=A0A0B2W448_TOXCA|nr:28S ribosomal protein S18a, mitochondrial [Toxocara canis]